MLGVTDSKDETDKSTHLLNLRNGWSHLICWLHAAQLNPPADNNLFTRRLFSHHF